MKLCYIVVNMCTLGQVSSIHRNTDKDKSTCTDTDTYNHTHTHAHAHTYIYIYIYMITYFVLYGRKSYICVEYEHQLVGQNGCVNGRFPMHSISTANRNSSLLALQTGPGLHEFWKLSSLKTANGSNITRNGHWRAQIGCHIFQRKVFWH